MSSCQFVEQLFETRLNRGHGTVPGWDIAGARPV